MSSFEAKGNPVRNVSSVGLWITASVLSVACAGAPAPVATPTVVPTKPVASTPPDLSPVPVPASIFFIGRLKNPDALVSTVSGWISPHIPDATMPTSSDLSHLLLGDAVTDILDVTKPVDLVVGLGEERGSFKGALSVAIRSMDEAKAELERHGTLVAIGNGMLRYDVTRVPVPPEPGEPTEDSEGESEPDVSENSDHEVCALCPSAGGSDARIVCATNNATALEFAPYLTRTMVLKPPPSDVQVELIESALKSWILKNRRSIDTGLAMSIGDYFAGHHATESLFGSSLEEVINFALDLDTFEFNADIDKSGIRTNATASFGGAASQLTRLLVREPNQVGAPPDTFWRLPGDSNSAFFHRMGDTGALGRARDLIFNALAEVATDQGLGEADQKAIRQPLTALLSFPPSVSAAGLDFAPIAPAPSKATRAVAPPSAEASQKLDYKLFGWHIVGLEAPGATTIASLKDFAAAVSRTTVTAWVKKLNPDFRLPTLKPVPVTAANGLLPGSLHLEFVVPQPVPMDSDGESSGKKKIAKLRPPPPKKYHIVAVPEAGHTWIGFAMDEASLYGHLRTVFASAPAVGSLAQRAGIEPLRSTGASSGGFQSVRGMVGSLMGGARHLDEDSSSSTVARAFEVLSAWKGGHSAALLSSHALAPSATAPAGGFTTSVTVPETVIDEALKFMMTIR